MAENNIAFIDGQNLHLGTTAEDWKIQHNYGMNLSLKDIRSKIEFKKKKTS